ncbi:hypothetical protein [Cellulomonas aerilata]|uniref:Lipoprotein n=1 Tax=Cellulomonas aerilata TaxID=515326 RepID=A0A512DE77_9CELL|nr:hypothetical protein [Cellulomonas aerilata]GEO34771.1 hypothetical protein CAE01nite_24960 [Cellulomonas aerilata]
MPPGQRPGVAAAAAATLLLVAGCAGSVEDQARRELEAAAREVHGAAVLWVASSPDLSARVTLEELQSSGDLTGGGRVERADGGVLVVTRPIGVQVERGGGLLAEDASAGACLRVTMSGPDGDDLGRVRTEAVPCPDGLVPTTGAGGQADVVDLDLGVLDDVVDDGDRQPGTCFGTTGDCAGG